MVEVTAVVEAEKGMATPVVMGMPVLVTGMPALVTGMLTVVLARATAAEGVAKAVAEVVTARATAAEGVAKAVAEVEMAVEDSGSPPHLGRPHTIHRHSSQTDRRSTQLQALSSTVQGVGRVLAAVATAAEVCQR